MSNKTSLADELNRTAHQVRLKKAAAEAKAQAKAQRAAQEALAAEKKRADEDRERQIKHVGDWLYQRAIAVARAAARNGDFKMELFVYYGDPEIHYIDHRVTLAGAEIAAERLRNNDGLTNARCQNIDQLLAGGHHHRYGVEITANWSDGWSD